MNETKFIFRSYLFNEAKQEATFKYCYGKYSFKEKIVFSHIDKNYSKSALDRALFLAFLTIGTSYYKAFPAREVTFEMGGLDEWQAQFADRIYQEGLSQFAFENDLTRKELATFEVSKKVKYSNLGYRGDGVLALQSGGKDSLLLATFLQKKEIKFTPWYIGPSDKYPKILNELCHPLSKAQRIIDHESLGRAKKEGALNGHVPVTFIVLSIALIETILNRKNTVLVSIGHEGEEPHAFIGDLPVTHQWSKTWEAERLFSEYIHRYISPNINVGSPLRGYSELRIAELFARYAWSKFGKSFSSCNRANYTQGQDNTQLKWCGECPKCANSYLLFAPFVLPQELQAVFNGQDLFTKQSLRPIFEGLLGIGDARKPFECIGEVDELRTAYYMAKRQWKDAIGNFPFSVPEVEYDYKKEYPVQGWVEDYLVQTIS